MDRKSAPGWPMWDNTVCHKHWSDGTEEPLFRLNLMSCVDGSRIARIFVTLLLKSWKVKLWVRHADSLGAGGMFQLAANSQIAL